MPEGLARQLDGITEYLQAAGIASWCEEGAEADDRIAAVARHAVAAGASVLIASSDKDFMQLVAPRIGLINPNDRIERIWTDAEVVAKTGVRPEQIVDWLSLIGDSVDNIPGVRGVGPKTATELLQRFGSIDGLYLRLPEVSSERLRTSLAAARGDMRRNQELIRLREEVGNGFDLAEARLREEESARLMDLFGRWGFRSMLAEIAVRQQPTQCQLL
jgi:DNA polymerase-1